MRALALAFGLILALPAAAFAIQADYGVADLSTNEDGFKVFRNADGGAYAEIGQTGPNPAAPFRDVGPLTQGVLYCYHAVAFNVAGDAAPGPDTCGATVSIPTSAGQGTLTIIYP